MITITERYLLQQLKSLNESELRFLTACKLLRANPKHLTINELSDQLCIEGRQLERIFKDQKGTGPKTYQRIVRFTHIYNHIQNNKGLVWTDLPYDNGFWDQSHFIRDFKEFTGESPTEFMALTQPFAPRQLSIDIE